jgi:hypothetical protein
MFSIEKMKMRVRLMGKTGLIAKKKIIRRGGDGNAVERKRVLL